MEVSIVKLICIIILSALIGGVIVFAIAWYLIERIQKAHEKEVRELLEKHRIEVAEHADHFLKMYEDLNERWAKHCNKINELWAERRENDLHAEGDDRDNRGNDNRND